MRKSYKNIKYYHYCKIVVKNKILNKYSIIGIIHLYLTWVVQPFIVGEPIYTFMNTLKANNRKKISHNDNPNLL